MICTELNELLSLSRECFNKQTINSFPRPFPLSLNDLVVISVCLFISQTIPRSVRSSNQSAHSFICQVDSGALSVCCCSSIFYLTSSFFFLLFLVSPHLVSSRLSLSHPLVRSLCLSLSVSLSPFRMNIQLPEMWSESGGSTQNVSGKT